MIGTYETEDDHRGGGRKFDPHVGHEGVLDRGQEVLEQTFHVHIYEQTSHEERGVLHSEII